MIRSTKGRYACDERWRRDTKGRGINKRKKARALSKGDGERVKDRGRKKEILERERLFQG